VRVAENKHSKVGFDFNCKPCQKCKHFTSLRVEVIFCFTEWIIAEIRCCVREWIITAENIPGINVFYTCLHHTTIQRWKT